MRVQGWWGRVQDSAWPSQSPWPQAAPLRGLSSYTCRRSSSPLIPYHPGDSSSVCLLLRAMELSEEKQQTRRQTRSRKQEILKSFLLTVKESDVTPAPRLSPAVLQPAGVLEMAALQASVGGGCLTLLELWCWDKLFPWDSLSLFLNIWIEIHSQPSAPTVPHPETTSQRYIHTYFKFIL